MTLNSDVDVVNSEWIGLTLITCRALHIDEVSVYIFLTDAMLCARLDVCIHKSFEVVLFISRAIV